MKYITVKLQDGIYQVPANVVAVNRARYFAIKDSGTFEGTEYNKTYLEEFNFTMDDELELCDWIRNNMVWDDIKDHIRKAEILGVKSLQKQWEHALNNGELCVTGE